MSPLNGPFEGRDGADAGSTASLDAALGNHRAAVAVMTAESVVLQARSAAATRLKGEAVRQLSVAHARQRDAEAAGDPVAIETARLGVIDAALHLVMVTGSNIVEVGGMLPAAAQNIRNAVETRQTVEDAQRAVDGDRGR